MEKLKERLALAERAVSKLEELASMDEWTEVERDAMIQRFEFSYEILWKCAKDYLRVFEGIDAASPRRELSVNVNELVYCPQNKRKWHCVCQGIEI